MTGKRRAETHLSGYEGLATALIKRAVRDAKLKMWRREALIFLSSVGCGDLMAALGDAMDMSLGRDAQRQLLQRLGAADLIQVDNEQ